jgi:ankyrin repeat protein
MDVYDFTPLHYAAWKGKTDAIQILLALGAKPNTLNRDMKTPLHLAASNGKASTVR